MIDCISREDLLKRLKKVSTEAWKMKTKVSAELIWNQCIDYVKDAPSVEPERKTGKWKIYPFGAKVECSVCKEEFDRCDLRFRHYCPNCGCYMEMDCGKD